MKEVLGLVHHKVFISFDFKICLRIQLYNPKQNKLTEEWQETFCRLETAALEISRQTLTTHKKRNLPAKWDQKNSLVLSGLP